MPIVKIDNCLTCHIKHEWLFDSLTLKELRVIKQLTGMTQTEMSEAGSNDDPEALAVLLYVLHLRDKIKIPFEDVDLDFKDFSMELTEDEQKEADRLEAEAERAGSSGPKPESGQPSAED